MSACLLLVDDHPLFRDGFAQMLRDRRPGWTLRLAGSAAEGLAALDGGLPVDLIIVDIQLPDGDGVEALEAIGRLHPTVPRVVISGREDPATRHRVGRSGASGFIAKAAPAEAIVAAIDAVLGGCLAFDAPPEGGPSRHRSPTARPRCCGCCARGTATRRSATASASPSGRCART